MKCKNNNCSNHGRREYSGYCDPCAELGLHTGESKPKERNPMECEICGVSVSGWSARYDEDVTHCKKCYGTEEAKQYIQKRASEAIKPNPWDSMLLTTSNSLPNIPDYEVLGIVASECVAGVDIFNDLFAAVRDIVGGRSQAMENEVSSIREQCLDQIKSDAYDLNASAVIALRIEFNQLSGGNKSMIFATATGTAVKVAKTQ